MTTAQAVTNEQGLNFNKSFTVGYSGHGGITKSCYSDFKLKNYSGRERSSTIADIEQLNPAAYKELIKVCNGTATKVSHQIAFTIKTNKEGKRYDSVLGQYLSFKLGKKKISALVKGYSCLFFVDDKKVTFLSLDLKV